MCPNFWNLVSLTGRHYVPCSSVDAPRQCVAESDRGSGGNRTLRGHRPTSAHSPSGCPQTCPQLWRLDVDYTRRDSSSSSPDHCSIDPLEVGEISELHDEFARTGAAADRDPGVEVVRQELFELEEARFGQLPLPARTGR